MSPGSLCGNVEKGSGQTFLDAVHDRSVKIPISLIKKWIVPGTTIIRDCWAVMKDIHILLSITLSSLPMRMLGLRHNRIHTETYEGVTEPAHSQSRLHPLPG
jgi:hypothetical protein